MKRGNPGVEGTSPRQWKWLRLDVALKTEVIARCRQRSDAECCALMMRPKPVKP